MPEKPAVFISYSHDSEEMTEEMGYHRMDKDVKEIEKKLGQKQGKLLSSGRSELYIPWRDKWKIERNFPSGITVNLMNR